MDIERWSQETRFTEVQSSTIWNCVSPLFSIQRMVDRIYNPNHFLDQWNVVKNIFCGEGFRMRVLKLHTMIMIIPP